ncbi:MAG: hypothetical protein FIB08_03715 [Candidatus Methanoperedens sp.]|nr:hypothetical protein [Candidatus Methanoperedens sp.]
MNPDLFLKHRELIKSWYENQDRIIEIDKWAQTGVTYNLEQVGLNLNHRICIFEPTNKIINETIEPNIPAGKKFKKIDVNQNMCPESIRDELFDWFHKGKCSECQADCGYKEVMEGDWDILAITYHKFNTLWSLPFDITKHIFKNYDVLILDEFSKAILIAPPIIPLSDVRSLLNKFYLMDIKSGLPRYERMAWENLDEILKFFEKIPEGNDFQDNPYCEDFYSLTKKKGLISLKNLIPKYQQNLFKNFIHALMYLDFKISIQKINDKKQKCLIPNTLQPVMALKSFLDYSNYNGKIFITGLALPHTTIFNGVRVEMPDYNETEKTRLIVLDRAKWNLTKDWNEQSPKIKRALEGLVDKFYPEYKILVIAMNTDIKREIERWNIKGIKVEEYAYITYYRSADTSGVRIEGDIVVCVGAPWTPQDSDAGYKAIYDTKEDVRKMEISHEMQQALGRGKDPEGNKRSIVFMLGVDEKIFKMFFPDKKEVVITYKVGGLPDSCHFYAGFWLGVTDKSGYKIPDIKYEDYQLLPMVSEIFKYCTNQDIKGRNQVPLSEIAQSGLKKYYKKLGLKKKGVIDIFERCKYLFPDWWKVKEEGSRKILIFDR